MMVMDIKKNIAVVSAALCLSSVYELEATSLAELQERFAAYGTVFSGKLGKQIRTARQELVYYVRVEDRDPWGFVAREMSSLYPFFEEYAINPIKIYFPGEIFAKRSVFTKSQWRAERCKRLLAHFEKIRTSAETGNYSTGLQEEFQDFLKEATAFMQTIHDENQRIRLEEKSDLKRQQAQINLEAYTASIPDDLKGVSIYLQNIERGIIDPYVDVAEMFEKQIQLMDWQTKWLIEQSLIPFLPKKAEQDQFLETNKRILNEAVADL